MNLAQLKTILRNSPKNIDVCDFETMKMLELLDASQLGKNGLNSDFLYTPYLDVVFTAKENDIANQYGKLPSPIKFANSKNSAYDFKSNSIEIGFRNYFSEVTFPRHFKHESFHSLELFALINQSFDFLYNGNNDGSLDKKIKDFKDKVAKDCNYSVPVQNGVKTVIDNEVLKQLILSYNVYLDLNKKAIEFENKFDSINSPVIQEVYTNLHNHYNILKYMTSFELEARISEFDIKVNDICKCPDLNIKLKELNNLKDDIENVQKIAKIQKTLVDSYIDYCERFCRKNKGLEVNIFNAEEMKKYLYNKIDVILKECDKTIVDIKQESNSVRTEISSHSTDTQFKNLNKIIDTLSNSQHPPINILIASINTLSQTVDIEHFKYYKSPNNNNSENNFKFFTDALLELYDNNAAEPQIINGIQKIFVEIFKTENNICLIEAGISNRITDIIQPYIDNKLPQFKNKLNDFDQLYLLNPTLQKFKNTTQTQQSQHTPSKIATCISQLLTKQKIKPYAPNIYNIPESELGR